MGVEANSIDKCGKIGTGLLRKVNHDGWETKMNGVSNFLQQSLVKKENVNTHCVHVFASFCSARHTCSEFFLSTSSLESVLIQGETFPTTSVFQS
jgi:hypothetical protein